MKPDCEMRVTVSHRDQLVSPLWTAAFLALAALLALAACWCIFSAGADDRWGGDVFELHVAVPAFFASFAAFIALPSYYHNDAVGGNLVRNWGYRGWGYFDTARDVAWRLAHEGIAGLPHVQTFGKPLGMPFFSLLTGFGASPYVAGPVQSAVLMALAAAAIALIAYWSAGSRAAVVAVAIFTLNPISLAYSTSFYEECGWIAGIMWAVVFAHFAMQRRSNWYALASILCAAFAVSAKQLLIVPLTIAVIAAGLLYLRHRIRPVLLYAVMGTLAVTVLSIFAWPFLWQDSAFRLPFILGARMTFDTVHGISSPLSARAAHAISVELVRSTPLQVALVLAAVVLWLLRQRLTSLWLAAAGAACIAFTVPTSFFLQHYVLYTMPFVALLCGDAAAWIFRRYAWVAAGALALVLQGGWSALFFPYTGMAALTCLNVPCALSSAGVSEPLYGLREAGQWLSANGKPADKIVTLAAPHVLQAYLPALQVLFAPALPPAAKQQQALLDGLHAKYVVVNDWYKRNDIAFSAPDFRLVYSTNARYGDVSIYARRNPGYDSGALPDLPESAIRALQEANGKRVLFIANGANVRTSHWIQNLIQNAPLFFRVPMTLSNIGSGTVIAPRSSALAAQLRTKYQAAETLGDGQYDVYYVR